MKVIIYTDGAAKINPDGPGGYGAILQYTDSCNIKNPLFKRNFLNFVYSRRCTPVTTGRSKNTNTLINL